MNAFLNPRQGLHAEDQNGVDEWIRDLAPSTNLRKRFGLDPNSVRLVIYAKGADDSESLHQEMKRGRQVVGANCYLYSAEVPANRPVTDYTARVVPHFPGAAVSLEATQILWQR